MSSGAAVLDGNRAVCPKCGKRLCDVSQNAMATGITLWCRLCRARVELDIGRGA